MSHRPTLFSLVLTALLFLPSPAQDLARRLILKDGSYQLVTKYEVKDDRVHYYSAERDEWEELPASLVDWPATDKYEKDREAGAAFPEAVQLDKEIEHERELAEAKLPQVAPGLRLPEYSGVFLLDTFQGERQLDEISQTAGDVSRSSRGIFRNPLAGLKQSIELDGPHATVQSHVDAPTLYINVDESSGQPGNGQPGKDHPRNDQPGNEQPGTEQPGKDQPAQSESSPQQPQQPVQPIVPFDRFRIVRAEVKSDRRILGDVKRQATGKVTQEEHVVKTTITNVTGGWLKLTPLERLAPGEYALVEMIGKETTGNEPGKEGMNLYVWDFGINPKAPANSNPWKPDTKAPSPSPAPAPAAKPN
jgi:hypothetical protein